MKKFFSKYLPVEGEIQEGDYYHHPDYKGQLFRHFDPWDWKEEKAQKVSLFLCSREILHLDTYFIEGDPTKYIRTFNGGDKHQWDQPENSYRIVGEILTEGVPENQEFSDREIEFLTLK